MVGIDGNGRDGGVEKRRYSSNLFSFFSLLLFLSFSFFFSFLFPCLFLFFFSFCFAFVTYFKISKEFTQNKDMEELFCGVLKRVCQSVKCNVLKGYVHVRGRWRRYDGCVSHLGV